MKKVLIVGAGLSGSYIARQLADLGCKVEIIEQRATVGGNLYDEVDTLTGCTVHKYGPHIFHTSDAKLWKFVNKFAEFEPFKLTTDVYFPKEMKYIKGPFNFATIDSLYAPEKAERIKAKMLEYFNLYNDSISDKYKTVSIVDLLSCEDDEIRGFAEVLWENDYKLYTSKQWGIPADEVDKSILHRVPFYMSYWDGIFNDDFIGVPISYNIFFANLLTHKNIQITCNTNAKEHLSFVNGKPFYKGEEVILVWTGAIDELFDYKYGELSYRTLDFKYSYAPHTHAELGDSCSTILPDPKYKFTRITNFGRLPIQNHLDLNVLCYEYPKQFEVGSDNERFYPINSKKDKEIYSKYEELLEDLDNTYLCGRLAQYKYYDMDKAIIASESVLKDIIIKELKSIADRDLIKSIGVNY